MADEASEDQPISFTIKTSGDQKFTLSLPLSTTVSSVKEKLSSTDYANLPPERQRLIYSGRVLKDDQSLATYKIKEGHTVHLVKGAESNVRQQPANQGTSSGSTQTPPALPNMAAGTGAHNMLAGLTGARYAGLAPLPNFSNFGPDGGMGPPPDPEQQLSMLENPAVRAQMNELLSNPSMVDEMIRMNPMLAQMPGARQMLQSPMFRQMMTDPDAMRSMMNMQRSMGMGRGAGATSAFPAPGGTGAESTGAAGEQGQNTQPGQGLQSPPPNPFAMFGAPGGAGMQGNPFAQLFNPGMFGQQPNTGGNMPPTGIARADGTTIDSADLNNPTPPSGDAPGQTQAREGQLQQPTNSLGATNPFAMMQNPMMQNMARTMMANPQMMQQMMQSMYGPQPDGSNPLAPSQPSDANNPLANPAGQSNPFAGLFGGGGMNPFTNPDLAAMLGGGSSSPQPPDNRPPEERYAVELRQLNDMGFFEFERNVQALRRSGGSVQGAVEFLLSGA